MKIITKNIANFLTSFNLFMGCVGIFLLFENEYLFAFYAMLAAAVADFFDGFAARLFKADDGIGKDLDSLADVVTFGVLPGFFLFHLAQDFDLFLFSGVELKWLALCIPVFSAWRLAKFNNDSRQSTGFLGLATPANAIVLAAFAIWAKEDSSLWAFPDFMISPWFLTMLILGSCMLLVSEIPLMALKFKGFSLKKDWLKIVLVISILTMGILFTFAAALPSLIIYIILSLLNHSYYEIQSRN